MKTYLQFLTEESKSVDHYAHGYKKAQTLKDNPKHKGWSHQGMDNKFRDAERSHENKHGASHSEYWEGLQHGWSGADKTHGVFAWRGDGNYQKSTPAHTAEGSSKARQWLEKNGHSLPHADSGYVVRPAGK